jgi:L-iditol 2-dehydrogenase
MKAAQLLDYENIRIEEVPIPEISPGDALVRMKSCGICGSDTMEWYIKKKAPVFLGHEPAGVVERVGPEVEGFGPGDRVFMHHHAPCFACHYCRKRLYSMCKTWKETNLEPGAIAEFVRVPAVNLRGDTLKLPEEMTFDDGALVEPLACAVKAFKKARFETGDHLVVIGLGPMGQFLVALGRYYGAAKVVASDLIPFRLECALRFGADLAVNVRRHSLPKMVVEHLGERKADVVIVGPGSAAAIEEGIECAGRGATVVMFTPTPPDEPLAVSPYALYFNEINLVPSYSCGPGDTREALELIRSGVVTADKMVTHRFPIEETAQAFRLAASAQDSLKVLVTMNGDS